jgi:hypothetical protein
VKRSLPQNHFWIDVVLLYIWRKFSILAFEFADSGMVGDGAAVSWFVCFPFLTHVQYQA